MSRLPDPSGAGWFQSTVKTPRSSSLTLATARIAFVRTSPMFVDAAFTSPQREPSGIVKRCSPRLRKIAFCCSLKARPCCRSSSAMASSASHSHWSQSRL